MEGFEEAISIFDEKITSYEPRSGPLEKSFADLDWFPRSYWQMRKATVKTEDMLEPLETLRNVFKDIWPWSLCYHAQTALREVTDNAVYTWEQALLKHAETGKADREACDKLKKQTIEKFKHDADIATKEFTAKVCDDVNLNQIFENFAALLLFSTKSKSKCLAVLRVLYN